MIRMKVWRINGYVRDVVSTANYQPRKPKTKLVAVVVSRSNTSYDTRMAKPVWLGAETLTAMIIQFIMAKSLWAENGYAVTRTVSTQNISNKKGQ